MLGDAQKRRSTIGSSTRRSAPTACPRASTRRRSPRPSAAGGCARAGFEFGGDADLGDVFSRCSAAVAAAGANPWPLSRQRQNRGTDISGQLSVELLRGGAGHRAPHPHRQRHDRRHRDPARVESGGRLRVPGKGGAAPGKGASPAISTSRFELLPDPHLRRQGDRRRARRSGHHDEAALGARVEVPTVEGRVTVSVPPGTSSGARLRLRGRGGIKRSDGSRGDQFCRIEIVAPTLKPDDVETRRLLEEIDRRTAPTQGPVRRF